MISSTPCVCVPETFLPCVERYARQHLTGRLAIAFSPTFVIHLYFNLGHFTWATGGSHPVRRLKRHLQRHCPDLMAQPVQLRQEDSKTHWDYNLILVLIRRGHINHETAINLIRDIILEVLFDLWQEFTLAPNTGHPTTTLTEQPGMRPSDLGILSAQSTLDTQALVTESLTQWRSWQTANLTRCSPNLALRVLNPEALAQATPPVMYRNFLRLINGQRTLRDMAAMMQQDIVKVARSLHPYVKQRLLGVTPLQDLPATALFALPPQSSPAAPQSNSAPSPLLVACIDDSPHLCHLMEQLLTDAGYHFLPISDPIKALPLLIQQKPDIIFLDLMMPIANGYEICTQIRRVSALKNTPVVVLTAQDGVVDRVRAKLAGATAFLSKPVNSDRILTLIKTLQD